MTETVLPAAPAPSPLLTLPGAVAGDGVDAAVAAHYGDPAGEQRRLAEGRARVDLSHRGVLRIDGPDRRSWLHSLTTQHLTDLAPGVSSETLVLSPHGHVEHDLHLVDDGTSTWITLEPGTAGALADFLRRMQFMLRVEVHEVTADWAVLGEAKDDALGAGTVAWTDPWPQVAAGGTSYAAEGEHPGWIWREVLVPRADLATAIGDAPAGLWAAEALRVAAWRPRLGAETDHRTIPHEVDWLRTAVHLQKGCYRGQETVARVHNLGRPPRRLVMLHLDGSGHLLPPAGSDVLLGDKVVGRVTTSARHHEDGPIALAVVKRSTVTDVALTVRSAGQEDVAASQEVVVRP